MNPDDGDYEMESGSEGGAFSAGGRSRRMSVDMDVGSEAETLLAGEDGQVLAGRANRSDDGLASDAFGMACVGFDAGANM